MNEELLKILENCNKNLIDAETAQVQVLDLFSVVVTFVCDIEKGTRCNDSFPDYKNGKCRNCGGQAN